MYTGSRHKKKIVTLLTLISFIVTIFYTPILSNAEPQKTNAVEIASEAGEVAPPNALDEIEVWVKIVCNKKYNFTDPSCNEVYNQETSVTIEGSSKFKAWGAGFIDPAPVYPVHKYYDEEVAEKNYTIFGYGSGYGYYHYIRGEYVNGVLKEYLEDGTQTKKYNITSPQYEDSVARLFDITLDNENALPRAKLNIGTSTYTDIYNNVEYTENFIDTWRTQDGEFTTSQDQYGYEDLCLFSELASQITAGIDVEAAEAAISPEVYLTYDGNKYVASGETYYNYTGDLRGSSQTTGTLQIYYKINAKPGVKEIQPNQALGRYAYKDEANYKPATDFVAGKDTAIQVFLPAGVKAGEQKSAQVKVYRDGTNIATLTKFDIDDINNSLIFKPKDRAACGNWQAGTYKFVATVGDSEELTLDNVQFREQRGLKILAIPIIANYSGTILFPGNEWTNAGSFLQRVYPIAYNNFIYTKGKPRAFITDEYDLDTEDGVRTLLAKLDKEFGEGYDAVIGFVKEPLILGIAQGATLPERYKSALVSTTCPYRQAVVAHEIAHLFYVGDEYPGGLFHQKVNSPPAGYVGKDFFDPYPYVTTTDTSVKPYRYGVGSEISEKLLPYDITRGLLPDMQSFMGADGPQDVNWISASIWKHLFNALGAPSTNLMNESLNETGGIRATVVTGCISRTGEVEFDLPWFTSTTTDSIAATTGVYTVQAMDESGNVLASNSFTPSFLLRSNPPKEIILAPFKVKVPFLEGTKMFRVVDQNNTILKELPVSSGVPVLNVTAPVAGDEIAGTASITWNAEDPDADTLYYKVEYAPDGINWETLAFDLTENMLVEDFSQLPGGDQAQIRVTASDGINNATAYSGIFKVPLKGPEVFIEDPVDNSTFSREKGVVLYGSAYDPQEGQIFDDNRLIWVSDRAGELGRGPTVYATDLEEGQHKITLIATNSAGMSAERSITLNIVSSIQLSVSPSPLNLAVGESQSLTPTVTPTDAAVSFISENPAVATVDQMTGLVTGISPGSTTVTVTAVKEGYTDVTENVIVNVSTLPLHTVTVGSNNEAWGTANGGGTFEEGTLVKVTAAANTGYSFVNWTEGGTVVSTDVEYTFTMGTADRSLAANFAPIPAPITHTVTVGSNNEAWGTASGGGTFEEGTLVKVTAAANTGYSFVNWTEGGTVISTNSEYTFTIGTTDRSLAANFAPGWPKRVKLSVKGVTANSVTLVLSEPIAGAAKYVVYYGEKRVEFDASAGTTLPVTSLINSTFYTFTVQVIYNEYPETTNGPSEKVKTKK